MEREWTSINLTISPYRETGTGTCIILIIILAFFCPLFVTLPCLYFSLSPLRILLFFSSSFSSQYEIVSLLSFLTVLDFVQIFSAFLFLFFFFSLSACFLSFFYRPIFFIIHLLFCLSNCVCVCVCVCVWLAVCLSGCLSVYLIVCLSVCLSSQSLLCICVLTPLSLFLPIDHQRHCEGSGWHQHAVRWTNHYDSGNQYLRRSQLKKLIWLLLLL